MIVISILSPDLVDVILVFVGTSIDYLNAPSWTNFMHFYFSGADSNCLEISPSLWLGYNSGIRWIWRRASTSWSTMDMYLVLGSNRRNMRNMALAYNHCWTLDLCYFFKWAYWRFSYNFRYVMVWTDNRLNFFGLLYLSIIIWVDSYSRKSRWF